MNNKIQFKKEKFISLIGYLLLFIGIIGLICNTVCSDTQIQTRSINISIFFFLTILSLAFIFPSMLKASSGDISTMRIIVFMMACVIGMLLLKMGIAKNSLTEIGLDQWWMGVIAFVFGAKATQSYFEGKKSNNNPPDQNNQAPTS
ncbi:MAG: hypothetical protein P4L28_04960 [Paludibacteraceae bacterium]|nr:hypothetical protein [Paludibacteraceae bacterium]